MKREKAITCIKFVFEKMIVKNDMMNVHMKMMMYKKKSFYIPFSDDYGYHYVPWQQWHKFTFGPEL